MKEYQIFDHGHYKIQTFVQADSEEEARQKFLEHRRSYEVLNRDLWLDSYDTEILEPA